MYRLRPQLIAITQVQWRLCVRPLPTTFSLSATSIRSFLSRASKLKRFGSDMFLNRGLAARQMSVDIPIGPDYVLGVGDGLIINLWGGVSQNFSRTVDREGKIALPEAGTIVVAGLSLERAQALVQGALSQQFRDAKVSVTIARLRTVRVYVVGDVQRPGAYDISSLSTPLNALYAAGGPTSIGSLRVARHYRGKELIREVDLYEFLLRGVRPDTERIEDGDTILVSPVGRQVAVAGMVKRPAIYELKDETTLSDVLTDAGGLVASASLTHITIERVEAQGHRTTLDLELARGKHRGVITEAYGCVYNSGWRSRQRCSDTAVQREDNLRRRTRRTPREIFLS